MKRLVGRPEVRLMDMGHTHYNEVANDRKTIYTATRSTGQIEKGPVGFSVTTIALITSPADERLIVGQSAELLVTEDEIKVCVMVWSAAPVDHVNAWPERGLLGTQFGSRKNGRKW